MTHKIEHKEDEGKKSTWNSLFRKEDWITVWIGFVIIAIVLAGVAFTGIVLSAPRISGWSTSIFSAIQVSSILPIILLAFAMIFITVIAV